MSTVYNKIAGQLVMAFFIINCVLNSASGQDLQNVAACESQIYCDGPLLAAMQNARIYEDSKTFVDLKMKASEEIILQAFADLGKRNLSKREAEDFRNTYFEGPNLEFEDWTPTDWRENPAFLSRIKDSKLRTWGLELHKLWKVLGRKISDDVRVNQSRYSLIYVPEPFIIPGGRFREFYYWDSYWVVKGLLLSEMTRTVKGMIKNFLKFVDEYGLVPNGGRVYYTRRSQPPFLIPMMKLYYDKTKDLAFIGETVDSLEKEYYFWINNRTINVARNNQTHRVARYAVEIGKPRPESYREDMETARTKTDAGSKAELYSHIASAAESGWDFSSRWMRSGSMSLSDLQTKDVIPVDLNAILCYNERILAEFYGLLGNASKQADFLHKAMTRRHAMNTLFWDDTQGAWFDYDRRAGALRTTFYTSNVFPMYFGCYGNDDGTDKVTMERKVLQYLKNKHVLDMPGGVPTSLINSTQQWDYPNAWPPLQDVTIQALSSSSLQEAKDIARNISQRWILTNWRTWSQPGPAQGHMYEKYDARIEGLPGRGGEYDVQIGFGWTNGVAMTLLEKYGDILHADSDVTSGSWSPATCIRILSLVGILIVTAKLTFHRS